MRHPVITTACAAFALAALPGCGTDDETADTTDAAAVQPAPGTAATVPPPGAPLPDEPMEGGAEVTVDSTAEYGLFLADKDGRPLYLFTADSAGQSNCYDYCAQMWPPLLAPQGTPTPGSAQVQAALLRTTPRRGGPAQVTYNGHPLYYYVKDAGAARPQGQDVHDSGGEWYLVTPRGQKLEDGGS